MSAPCVPNPQSCNDELLYLNSTQCSLITKTLGKLLDAPVAGVIPEGLGDLE